ncbi:uncharacterized protein [Paramisgurnus dabryanus]|uniref:uncharacterized protein n=1 Tax=Paramisgurnus dabryanus TaxID=90735 RepID=UPI0031F3EC87
MEGVLEATLFICLCKLMFSVVLCLPSVVRTFTAAGLCCICLLLFTDLIIALILIYVRITECWLMPFQVSSDVIALRFLLFLCQAYGVVMLLMPPLIVVELLVDLLRSQDSKEDAELDKDANTLWSPGASLSQTIGYISCLFVWIVSAFYSSNNLMLGQLSTKNCLEGESCIMNCLPGFPMTQSPGLDELSWIVPGMVLLLILTGGLGLLKTKAYENTLIHRGGSKDTEHTHIQLPIFDKAAHLYVSANPGTDSEKTPDSCAVHRAGFVYNEKRWFCPGNVALCTYQTGFVQQKTLPTGHTPLFQYKTKLRQEITSSEVDKMKHCDYKKTQMVLNETLGTQRKQSCRHETESPCLGEEMLKGLVCAVLVCVFPTVVSCNVFLILNLETLVVHSVKLLSLSAHRVSAL